MPAMLALLDDAAFGDEPLILASNAAPLRRVAGGDVTVAEYFFEAAGERCFQRYEAQASSKDGSSEEDEDEDEDEEVSTSQGAKKGDKKEKNTSANNGGILKLSTILQGVKLYKLLGVSEGASQDDIKKAYRALALSSHPDKLASMDAEEAKQVQERFVQIQEAYELLSDPAKRQLYDSTLEFDDSLPRMKAGDGQDFYEVFTEAFQRNARFSSRKPVPELGGPETPLTQVKKFYDFWYGFQSWRDPLALAQANDEELQDLDEAECREEKRWMMRENARVAKKYKQAEQQRVSELVRRAETHDPRILAEKEAKKAARAADAARREEERMAAQRAKEEAERQRLEAEEAERAVEAEKRRQEKAVKESAKAELKKCRQRLRAFHPQVKAFVLLDQLNEVCLQLSTAELQELCEKVEAALAQSTESAVELLHGRIQSLGLKPVIPPPEEEEDTASTSDGASDEGQQSASASEAPSPQAEEERRQREELAEARRKAEELAAAERKAEADRLAAEARKQREEQRRKTEQAAEAKRRQQEKKEREKAKKAEEKQRKAEELEQQQKEQQREDAKKRAAAQAEKDRAEELAAAERKAAEYVERLFLEDRTERLELFDAASECELLDGLREAADANESLRGSLGALKEAAVESAQRLDCLMTLVSFASPVWQLGLDPPEGVALTSAVRNRVKKARLRLRDIALKFLERLPDQFGIDAAAAVTDYQQGMIDGQYEWRVWSLEEREAELVARAPAPSTTAAVEEEPHDGQPKPAAGKKGKAKAGKPEQPEEDLDALFAEFGVTIQEKKSKSSRKKK